MMQQRVLVSIHDVMPETLSKVAALLETCHDCNIRPVTLLVVPGREWSNSQLDQLRHWQASGHQLAGHGWSHHCPTIRDWYHRLHSVMISRRAAEHLSLSPSGRFDLMMRCGEWFEQHQFSLPPLYVPPAWALGRLPKGSLKRLPFQMVETLGGVREIPSGRRRSLPLLGYETDILFKATFVSLFNSLNRIGARLRGVPIRLSIHPDDGELLLRRQLLKDLKQVTLPIGYDELFLHSSSSRSQQEFANKQTASSE